jgi:AraC-like DNA-binding protein
MENSALKYLGIFFLIAAAQGLFFAFSQLSIKNKLNPPRVFLALIICFFSIGLIESGLWWSGKIDDFVNFVLVSQPLPFLYGPLVYLYFRSSFSSNKFVKKDLLHFIPFFLYFIYCSQFYFSSTAAKNGMMRDEVRFTEFFGIYISSIYCNTLIAISHISYSIIIWKQFYSKISTLKEIKLWFLLIYGVFVFYAVNFAVFHLLSYYRIISGCADYGISSAMSIFVYLFSWFGFVRPKVFDGYSMQEVLRPSLPEKYRSSTLTESLEGELRQRLQELMQREKLYKDENIRLESLAERLGVSRNNISQVINRSGMNFFEYINHWRIEEAKKLLAETSKRERNIIEVAYEVGFNNKVSFNKFFKKSTGLTPTEFRRTALEK